MKFFDQKNNRLVFIEESATPAYWDEQWNVDLKKEVTAVRDGVYVQKITEKYIPRGGKILEGGCGKGQYVYALKRWGYEVVGVDYAPDTIKKVKEYFPELNIIEADVRHLPFEDSFFDGYWSFGVIEHFYEGFEKIAKEMARVLKNEGCLFITFPHMSLLRRLKASLKRYPPLDEQRVDLNKFYQFALDEKRVIALFNMHGFSLKEKRYLDGVKGLKDEVALLNALLKRVYTSPHRILKIIKYILNVILKRITSHSILLVLKISK